MRTAAALSLAVLLAACSSSSERAGERLVTLVATPDSIFQHRRLDTPVFVSNRLPLGDGRGGFVWLNGTPATADEGVVSDDASRRVEAARTALVDLDAAVAQALGAAAVGAWQADARRVADSVAAARDLLPDAARQAADRVLVAHGLHRGDAAGARVAFDALVRLGHAGSPDASLALYAIGRLTAHADARMLEAAGAQTAAAAEAWLERPFRPFLLTKTVEGEQVSAEEAVALRHQEQAIVLPSIQERMALAQAAEALAR